MKIYTPICPTCGEGARGTLETITACARFSSLVVDEHGQAPDVEFLGETDVFWDSQMTQEDTPIGGSTMYSLLCENGHDWPSRIDWDDDQVPQTGEPPVSLNRTVP